MGSTDIVIIGGGIAGVTAAKEIRTQSEEARITLISRESVLPYYRLSLTRYMAGEVDRATLPLFPDAWYQKNRIELISNRGADAIDISSHRVILQSGMEIPYDKLILAMGARPMVPPIPGSHLANVLTVRTLTDADALLEKLQENQSCIAIGGGLLGLETAGAIARKGTRVTLLEVAPWLLPRQLSANASVLLTKKVESYGIQVRAGVKIARIVGEEACAGIELDTGEFLPAKLIVITAGIIPETQLAREAGIITGKGVVVDAFMRTSDESVFAAGDITEFNGTIGGLWNIAQQQGRIAGLNAVGLSTPYAEVPRSHNLKVLGMDVFSMGGFMPDNGDVFLERQEEERYLSFVCKEGVLTGGIVLGDRALAMKAKSALDKKRSYSDEAFASMDAFLGELTK